MENKWIRAAIPALLIHCSIGTVYCWSIFKAEIAAYINSVPVDKVSPGDIAGVEWAFSIAIFCLGMSAAFGGKFVEKDIKKSSLLAMIFFVVGLVGTAFSIQLKSLIGIYIFYGLIMGIGLGIGYLTPVKNLMLWFKDHKGLGTGLAVAGFGLAKVIASPIMIRLEDSVGVEKMFLFLAVLYFIMMLLGHLLIKRPPDYVASVEKDTTKKSAILKQPIFIAIWLVFFLNITCGLALISQEKAIIHDAFSSESIIAAILMIDAVFNAIGRLGYSSLSDNFHHRDTAYRILLGAGAVVTLIAWITNALSSGLIPVILILLFVVNSSYGGGFSTLPVLLEENFGMRHISMIHGLALSAWGFAGIAGNQLSSFIVNKLGKGYGAVVVLIFFLYVIAFVLEIASRKMRPEEF